MKLKYCYKIKYIMKLKYCYKITPFQDFALMPFYIILRRNKPKGYTESSEATTQVPNSS